jgi:putative transposase
MRSWHHAPVHSLDQPGAYILTAGTYLKQHFFATPERLTLLHDRLLDLAEDYGCSMQAWSLFSNHYHFVCLSPPDPADIRRMITQLHWETAVSINHLDGTPGRQVWFNYWDKHITFHKSYLVRLKYVHNNPVKHRLVQSAETYPWCSAAWFERTAPPGFARTVKSFGCDKVNVLDTYEPLNPWTGDRTAAFGLGGEQGKGCG